MLAYWVYVRKRRSNWPNTAIGSIIAVLTCYAVVYILGNYGIYSEMLISVTDDEYGGINSASDIKVFWGTAFKQAALTIIAIAIATKGRI